MMTYEVFLMMYPFVKEVVFLKGCTIEYRNNRMLGTQIRGLHDHSVKEKTEAVLLTDKDMFFEIYYRYDTNKLEVMRENDELKAHLPLNMDEVMSMLKKEEIQDGLVHPISEIESVMAEVRKIIKEKETEG